MSDLFNPWEGGSVIKDSKLGSYYRAHVVDKAPLDASVPTSYLASALPRWRVNWLGAVMMIGCLLLLLRLAYLQVVHGSEYRVQADDNRIQITNIPAARGIIYDLTGTALVENEANFVATVVPTELPQPPKEEPYPEDSAYMQTLTTIASTVGLDRAQLQTDVEEHATRYYNQPLVIREFIPHPDALNLMSQLKGVAGVHIEAQASRHYLKPEVYAPVIGYLGRISPEDLEEDLSDHYALSDHIGKTGLEYTYESTLRGEKGNVATEMTARGKALNVIAQEEAVPGGNLVLGIDDRLQQLLYDEIKKVVDARGLPGGAAVALDPRTGKVRALVSYPSYDPNLFIQGITADVYSGLLNDARKPLFDKAISGEYPSGSTFKLVMAAAALQEGVVTPSTTVSSTGGLCINCTGYPDFPDWKVNGGHGITDVYKAIAESVNTYFYLAGGGTYHKDTREITGGLGIERINRYANLFGLGETSGIDLPGEADGFIPDPEWKEEVKGETWYLGDTYHVSIGQGDLLVTPLQVALYTMVVANGGTLYEPELVDHIADQAGQTTQVIESKVKRSNVVDPANLAVVRQGMRDAVTVGSARSMNSLPYSSAGKTGTAEIGETGKKHSWYSTFAPYEEPKLVLSILIEEGGDGTEAAVPVAKAVLSQYNIDSTN